MVRHALKSSFWKIWVILLWKHSSSPSSCCFHLSASIYSPFHLLFLPCLKPRDLPKVNVYGDTPITHASLPFFFSFSLREPVSCFPEDSIYAVLPPQVGKNSQEVFEGHVMTGQGQVRALCREDMLMYREYIKNRYMWDTDNTDWISVTSVNGKHDQLLKMFRRH